MSKLRYNPAIQTAFDRGYDTPSNADNPYCWSSYLWEAFELGKFFRANALDSDRIAPSRGHSFRTARGGLFRLAYNAGRDIAITEEQTPRKIEREPLPLLDTLEYVRATLKLRHIDEATDDEVEEALAMASSMIAKAKGEAQ